MAGRPEMTGKERLTASVREGHERDSRAAGSAYRNAEPPDSGDLASRDRLAGGSAGMATRVAVAPWLCVTAFRRLCSESAARNCMRG